MNINLFDEALNELDQKYIDRAAKSFRAESGRNTVVELTAVEPPTDIKGIKEAKKPKSTAFRVMTAAASIAAAFAVVIGSVFVIDRFRTDVLEKGAGAATSDISENDIPTVSASDFIGGHEPVDPMTFVKTDTVESIGVAVYPDPRGGRWYSEGFTHDGEGSSGSWAFSVFNEDGSFEATYVSEKTFDGYLEASKTYVPCFTDKGFAMTEYRYDDDLGQYSTTITFYDDDFNAVREYSCNYDNAKDMGGTALSQDCEYMLTVCADRIVINKLQNADGQVTAVYSGPRGLAANTVIAPVISSDGKSLLFIDSQNSDNDNSKFIVSCIDFDEDGTRDYRIIDDDPPQNPIDDFIGYGQCITLSRHDSVYAYGLDFNVSALIDLGENERVKHFHASPKAEYFIAVIRNTVTDAHRIEVFKLDNGVLNSVKKFDVTPDIVMHDQLHGIACVNDKGTVFVLGPTGISRTYPLDYEPSANESEYQSEYQYELEDIDLSAPAVRFTRSDTPYISDDAIIEIDPYSGNTIVRTNIKSGGRMVFSVFDSKGDFIETYMSEKTVSEYAVEDRIDCGLSFTESGFIVLKHYINSDGKINAFAVARYDQSFEPVSETLMQTIPAEESYYLAECSANGKYLLTIRDGVLSVYGMDGGEALRTLDLSDPVQTDDGRTVTLSSFVHPMINNDGDLVNVIARTNENESVMTYIDLNSDTVNAFAYDFLDDLKGISGGSCNFACYTDDTVAKFGFKSNTMNLLGDNRVDAQWKQEDGQEGEQVGFMQKADNEVVKYFTISPNGRFYLVVLHNNETNIETAKVYKCDGAMPVFIGSNETYPKSSYNINDLGSVFCVGSRKLSSVHLKATGQPWSYGNSEKAINDVTNDFTYDDAYISGSSAENNELWDYLERQKELMSQLEAENERLEKDKELEAENERLKRESELLSQQEAYITYPVIGKIFDVPCEVTMPFGVNGYDAICISPESHEGTPIHTIMSGRVIHADWDTGESGNSGYGKYVLIDHGNGYWTRYSHCGELFVSEGQEVSEGDVIASVGATGFITGPCLRFELIFNCENVDPAEYVVR